MNIQIAVVLVIGIFVAILIATSLGPTVIQQIQFNDYNASGGGENAGALQNASGTAQTMYSLVELLYPIMIVIFMISVGFGIGKKI